MTKTAFSLLLNPGAQALYDDEEKNEGIELERKQSPSIQVSARLVVFTVEPEQRGKQMKIKPRRGRQPKEDFENAVGQKRMEAYLKATQAEFEAAVERANLLGRDVNGVLAGPRVRLKTQTD